VILAVMVQEIPIGKITFRVLFYIPAVVSGVVILFMWRAIYDPSPDGALNSILGFIGIPAQSWLQDPAIAMICVVFPLAWAHLGPGSLIYLAALKGIPDDLYEAADIDGAGFFSKIRSIVIPYLRPLIIINAVGATIFGFKSGDAVLAMTGGGPNLATQVVGYEIWQRSFLYLKFGEATAMAWILGLVLMAFTAYQMRVLSKVEFRTAK
jgi:multiple sugar transport system permease protein